MSKTSVKGYEENEGDRKVVDYNHNTMGWHKMFALGNEYLYVLQKKHIEETEKNASKSTCI